jgi:hypothetical protein
VADQEVGRWPCDKCQQPIVAVGVRQKSFRGIGAYMGPCPWGCGAWITRGFRWIQPGNVRVLRAHEWDERLGLTG